MIVSASTVCSEGATQRKTFKLAQKRNNCHFSLIAKNSINRAGAQLNLRKVKFRLRVQPKSLC